MVSNKRISVNWLKFAAVQIVLFSAGLCFAAEPIRESFDSNAVQSEQDKAKALREVAQNWIDVGVTQLKRGFYEQAEASFLTAHGYKEYLTVSEYKKLDENLTTAHHAVLERKAALELLEKAANLLKQDQFSRAKPYYEKLRSSQYLSEQERKQIAAELKIVDTNLDKQKKKISALYNHSVELYKKGELEKARDGFAEVAKSALFVAPKGQSAEEYLVQIDNVLTAQHRSISPAETAPPPSDKSPQPGKQQRRSVPEKVPEQANELEEIAETQGPPAPSAVERHAEQSYAPAKSEPKKGDLSAGEAKAKIICAYTKALVDDTAVKVGYYIGRGEPDKAVIVVRNTTDVVQQNRPILGDELFTQYTIRLKQLTNKIIQARKAP